MQPEAATSERTPAQAEKLCEAWKTKIDDAQKREKTFRKLGKESVDLYEAKDPENVPFAILYSNIEVLAPAVYNAQPVPVVQRRYKDEDPLGKAAADVSTRALKYLVDTESQDYDTFDDVIQGAVLDGLITNRGLSRYKYVAGARGLSECVYGEAVRWDKFSHGYARTWKKVPWISFEWDMTEAEVRDNFPEKTLDFKNFSESSDEENSSETKEELQGVKLVKVYEVWDKRSRKVYFFSACCPKEPLKEVEDPLGLTGFFPVPKPLNFMRKVTTLIPTPLYQQYRQQAQELNEITRRLKAIIRAIKYRGAFNSAVEGIEKMLAAEDNELVPVENVASMPDGTGMDKLLWIVPVAELAATAQSLYQQREQVKQVIYEITGISDILRGASVASETATAQTIKNQWGSLRLKKMQKEVQRYCREALAIMLEIAAAKFELDTLIKMTGADYPRETEKAQIQQKIQMDQMMAMQAPAQPGQPPTQPKPVPPEIQALLAKPSWEEIAALMQNDVLVNYKTDIEMNSTLDAEAAQDKQDISELLNALSQFLNGLAPLVEKGMMPFEVAKTMMLTISRRFNFGAQLEDSLQAMKQPPPPQEDAGAAAEVQAKQAESQLKMQEAQQKAQISKQEFEQTMKLLEVKAQIETASLNIKRQELALQEKAVEMKLQQQAAQHTQKMELIAAQTRATETKEKEPANAAV